MLTAAKTTSRPALVHARSSFNAGSGSRAASMLASSDIFDTPGRLIFEEDPIGNASFSSSRKYYPSHFRPQSQDANTCVTAVASDGPVMHKSQPSPHPQTLAQQPQARQMSTLAHYRNVNDGSAVMFDGPARPRNPPRVTSRHVRASSTVASASAVTGEMKDHASAPAMPDPIIYDGPARPPRKVPVQLKKSSTGANASTSAITGTVVGLVGLGAAYELYEANRDPQSAPKVRIDAISYDGIQILTLPLQRLEHS
ncbi:hypothetical protein A7U60_g5888 [Sanghuangporus baumii]|uniref:Uncharacterized protein n=1 Tax=Sanghuangporus baumii TaxID=108892 RepID=A0A9Q5HVY0_SANBA|nr:hypothetical protein A7U60_g5888 [Sanghuangporus baumii]